MNFWLDLTVEVNRYPLHKIGKFRLIVNRLSIEEPSQFWPVSEVEGEGGGCNGSTEAHVAALVVSHEWLETLCEDNIEQTTETMPLSPKIITAAAMTTNVITLPEVPDRKSLKHENKIQYQNTCEN